MLGPLNRWMIPDGETNQLFKAALYLSLMTRTSRSLHLDF